MQRLTDAETAYRAVAEQLKLAEGGVASNTAKADPRWPYSSRDERTEIKAYVHSRNTGTLARALWPLYETTDAWYLLAAKAAGIDLTKYVALNTLASQDLAVHQPGRREKTKFTINYQFPVVGVASESMAATARNVDMIMGYKDINYKDEDYDYDEDMSDEDLDDKAMRDAHVPKWHTLQSGPTRVGIGSRLEDDDMMPGESGRQLRINEPDLGIAVYILDHPLDGYDRKLGIQVTRAGAEKSVWVVYSFNGVEWLCKGADAYPPYSSNKDSEIVQPTNQEVADAVGLAELKLAQVVSLLAN